MTHDPMKSAGADLVAATAAFNARSHYVSGYRAGQAAAKEHSMDKPDDKDTRLILASEAIHHLRRFRDSISWQPADDERPAHSLRVINSEDIDRHAQHAANALTAWDEARRGQPPGEWVKASAMEALVSVSASVEATLAHVRTEGAKALFEATAALVAAESRIAVEVAGREVAERRVCELREAGKESLRLCRGCDGSGTRVIPCTMCHDSTWDHHCNDREVPCGIAACIRMRAALASTADIAGRWVEKVEIEHLAAQVAAIMVDRSAIGDERDAAIARADEAMADLDTYEQRIREIADDVFGVQPAHGASIVLLDAIGRQCHRERIERLAAERARDEAIAERDELRRNAGDVREELLDAIEAAADMRANPSETYADAVRRIARARDEVGIQYAAAQERLRLAMETVEMLRPLVKRRTHTVDVYDRADDALRALDTVPGDALAPTLKVESGPVCSWCNDTHMMDLDDRRVLCTRCPVPCNRCREGGNGPYCSTTPCRCACHPVPTSPAGASVQPSGSTPAASSATSSGLGVEVSHCGPSGTRGEVTYHLGGALMVGPDGKRTATRWIETPDVLGDNVEKWQCFNEAGRPAVLSGATVRMPLSTTMVSRERATEWCLHGARVSHLEALGIDTSNVKEKA